jgi:WD40 repeat protein
MYCLDPPLRRIPKGEWFCVNCRPQAKGDPAKRKPIYREPSEFGDEEDSSKKSKRKKVVSPPVVVEKGDLDYQPFKPKKQQKPPVPESDPNDTPTYVQMIEFAIRNLGGSGTTPEIINEIKKHYEEFISERTKTWKNSVSGCLSTNFERVDTDDSGKNIWALKSDHAEKKFLKPPARTHPKLYSPAYLKELQDMMPPAPQQSYSIKFIDSQHKLKSLETLLQNGPVSTMALSNDGKTLAATSNGYIYLWNCSTWTLQKTFVDSNETGTEEFYNLIFSPDDKSLICAGKRRQKGGPMIDDNHVGVLAPSIKVFDLSSGTVIAELKGHVRDIFAIRIISFKKENFIVSAGADGMIIKWQMSADYTKLTKFNCFFCGGSSILAFDFIPQSGNKFLLASSDHYLKILDFENESQVQVFPDAYGFGCDFIKFIQPVNTEVVEGEVYFITRGVELVDDNDRAAKFNTAHLRKLSYPKEGRGRFLLEALKVFTDSKYEANAWPMKLGTNGKSIACPTNVSIQSIFS